MRRRLRTALQRLARPVVERVVDRSADRQAIDALSSRVDQLQGVLDDMARQLEAARSALRPDGGEP